LYYLYTFYLVGGLGPGTSSREEALYRLFKVMLDAAGSSDRARSMQWRLPWGATIVLEALAAEAQRFAAA